MLFLFFRHSLFLCFLHVQNKQAHQGQYLPERKEVETEGEIRVRHADCQTERQLSPSDVCDGRPFKVYYSIISAACAPTHHCPYQLDIMIKMQQLRNDRFTLCLKVYVASAGLSSFIEVSVWLLLFWLL